MSIIVDWNDLDSIENYYQHVVDSNKFAIYQALQNFPEPAMSNYLAWILANSAAPIEDYGYSDNL